MKTLWDEIGVRLNDDQNLRHLHHFFYNAQYKMRKEDKNEENSGLFKDTPFEVFYEFSLSNFQQFIFDEIGSQLIYLFVRNYSDVYMKCMRKTFNKAEQNGKSITKFIDKIKE